METQITRESPPPGTPPPSPAATSPLDDADFAMVRKAVADRKAVRNAARNAMSSAVVTLIIGVSGIPFTLFWPSWSSVLITAAICAVGVVELVGAGRMRRADPSASRLLGINQLAFVAAIAIYCMVQMLTFSTEQAKAAALSPEVRTQMGAMGDIERSIDEQIDLWAPILTYGFYFLIIAVSICCQGGLSLYYFTRRRHIESFNRQTPQWIRRLFVEIRV